MGIMISVAACKYLVVELIEVAACNYRVMDLMEKEYFLCEAFAEVLFPK